MSDLADKIERLCGAAAGAETTARQDGLIAKLYVLIEANLPAITAALRASRPEPAADAVEAAALELFLWCDDDEEWEDVGESIRQHYRDIARRVLALAAPPRPAVDEGAVERAVAAMLSRAAVESMCQPTFCTRLCDLHDEDPHAFRNAMSAALAAAQEGS